MQDPTDGFIGIKKNGRNGKVIEKHENKLAEEMTKFKDEKFLYFIFINILWIIVSCTILKYSYLLGHIDIDITANEKFHSCGIQIDDEENPPCETLRDGGYGYDDYGCENEEKFVYRLQDQYRPPKFIFKEIQLLSDPPLAFQSILSLYLPGDNSYSDNLYALAPRFNPFSLHCLYRYRR